MIGASVCLLYVAMVYSGAHWQALREGVDHLDQDQEEDQEDQGQVQRGMDSVCDTTTTERGPRTRRRAYGFCKDPHRGRGGDHNTPNADGHKRRDSTQAAAGTNDCEHNHAEGVVPLRILAIDGRPCRGSLALG